MIYANHVTQNHIDGKMSNLSFGDELPPSERKNDLAVVTGRLDSSAFSSRLELLPGWITTKLKNNDFPYPALGVIMAVNRGPEVGPAILTGIIVSETGTSLPPGCEALYLDDYNGPVSDFSNPKEILLAIAFLLNFHKYISEIQIVDITSEGYIWIISPGPILFIQPSLFWVGREAVLNLRITK